MESGYDVEGLLASVDFDDNKHRALLLASIFLATYVSILSIQYLTNSGEWKFWNSCGWAGVQTRLFPKTRAGIDAIRHTREIVEQGYNKVRHSIESQSSDEVK